MKKRGRGAMIAVILVALVVFGGLYGTWNFLSTAISPSTTTQTTQPTGVNIQNGESTDAIANDLFHKGLISNPLVFRLWARIKGLDTHLEAGSYSLITGMSMDDIIAKLQNGQPDARTLLVQDGWRIEQIANQINTLGLASFNEQQFLTYAHNPSQFPDVGKYLLVKHASSMEGLLFPDTYFIPTSYNTVQIIDMMLDEMQQVIADNHLVALAQQHNLSEYQMVVLASIAQREAGSDAQMPLIAGIYWKRINQPSSDVGGPYLKSDPTVEYAYDTDHPPSKITGYWGDLNNLGTGPTVDPNSPWNTYTHSGWPITPIASPNLDALKAAASPIPTNCYYFFSKPDRSLICEPTYQLMLQNE